MAVGADHVKPSERMPWERRGRAKGTRNHITREQRLMVLDSLHELGGVDFLVWLGKKHPAVWGSIFKETMPKRVEHEGLGDGLRPIIQVVTGVPHPEPKEQREPDAASRITDNPEGR